MLPATAPDIIGPRVLRLRPARLQQALAQGALGGRPEREPQHPGRERVDAAALGPGHQVGLHPAGVDPATAPRRPRAARRSASPRSRRPEGSRRPAGPAWSAGSAARRTPPRRAHPRPPRRRRLPSRRRRSGSEPGRPRRGRGAARAASPGCGPGSAGAMSSRRSTSQPPPSTEARPAALAEPARAFVRLAELAAALAGARRPTGRSSWRPARRRPRTPVWLGVGGGVGEVGSREVVAADGVGSNWSCQS